MKRVLISSFDISFMIEIATPSDSQEEKEAHQNGSQ